MSDDSDKIRKARTIAKALDIMLNNSAFFLHPYQDLKAFQNWIENTEPSLKLGTELSNLNNEFSNILSRSQQEAQYKSKYADALVGDILRKDTNTLQYGDVAQLAKIFENNEEDLAALIAYHVSKSGFFEQWHNDHPRQCERNLRVAAVGKIQPFLHEMEQKKQMLEDKGYSNAAKDAEAFISGIKSNIKNYVDDNIDKNGFVINCERLVETAKKSELKEHRGFFAKLFTAIINVLKKLNMGQVELKETDSVQKLNKFKGSISVLKSTIDSKQPPEDSEDPSP